MRAIPLARMLSTPVPRRQRKTSSKAARESLIVLSASVVLADVLFANSRSWIKTPAATACSCSNKAGMIFSPKRSRKSESICADRWASVSVLDRYSCAIRDLRSTSSSPSSVSGGWPVGDTCSCCSRVLAWVWNIMENDKYDALHGMVSMLSIGLGDMGCLTVAPRQQRSSAICTGFRTAAVGSSSASSDLELLQLSQTLVRMQHKDHLWRALGHEGPGKSRPVYSAHEDIV
jgi:hypothetical protein